MGPAGDSGTDPYLGNGWVTAKASGYFRVAQVNGRWWFVTPAGNGFLSLGVNTTTTHPDKAPSLGYSPYNKNLMAKYGSEVAWAAEVLKRYLLWGFNTLGAWSKTSLFKGKLPYTKILYISGASWGSGGFPDVFDPSWVAGVKTAAAKDCSPQAKDPWLLGYFLDNEMSWTPDHRNMSHLLDRFLLAKAKSPGREAAVAMLKKKYSTIAALNANWGSSFSGWSVLESDKTPSLPSMFEAKVLADREAFLALAADAYFATMTAAVRAADPNHLILGNRFIGILSSKTVLKVAGTYCDVISVQPYELNEVGKMLGKVVPNVASLDNQLKEFADITGRPLMISEFGWRAADSGLPNSHPPIYPTLKTQAERADRYRKTVEAGLSKPWVIGYHWFQHSDQPKEGRFDGEDNNWGLVNIKDEPYITVVSAMTKTHARAVKLHLVAK